MIRDAMALALLPSRLFLALRAAIFLPDGGLRFAVLLDTLFALATPLTFLGGFRDRCFDPAPALDFGGDRVLAVLLGAGFRAFFGIIGLGEAYAEHVIDSDASKGVPLLEKLPLPVKSLMLVLVEAPECCGAPFVRHCEGRGSGLPACNSWLHKMQHARLPGIQLQRAACRSPRHRPRR
jgi:hypothetical protein